MGKDDDGNKKRDNNIFKLFGSLFTQNWKVFFVSGDSIKVSVQAAIVHCSEIIPRWA